MPSAALRRFRCPRLEMLENRLALATLFVAPTGNDANDGSATAPWQTLQKAADSVQAGDSVIVRPGNYAGFDLRTDGTAASPITFSAEPGTIIDSRNPVTNDGINLEGADYVVIEGFTVQGMPRAGIRSVVNQHVTIRNNETHLNGVWGIFTGFSDDLIIEGNVTSRSEVEHGIYVSNSGDRPTIRNNTSWGNRGNGIHMNGDLSAGGDGIISGALVEGNIIYENGIGGGSGINADGVQASRFQNNLLYNNHASGISLYRIDGAAPSSNNIVVNNTIVQAADARWALNIQNASTNNTVRNNILFNNHSFRGSIDISSDSLPGFTSDYNVVMDRFTTNGGDSVMTLAQWQAATGQDSHSIIATPSQLFVDAANNDYHLSATSPAVDAGTSQNAPTVDFEGTPRPGGAGVDIGADERPGDGSPTNGPPQATADQFSAVEDEFIDLDVLFNDSDPDEDPLSVINLTQPANGSVALLPNGLVRYTPHDQFNGSDSFTYQASDGAASSQITTVSLQVSAVNDPPLNTVPAGQTTLQDTALTFSTSNGNAIHVSDIDASAGLVQFTIDVTNGTLTLSQTSGLEFLNGDGTADPSMTFRSALSDLNAALNGLRFAPAAGFSGTASIHILTDDLGNSGSGGAKTDSDSISVVVQPSATNHPPSDLQLDGTAVPENSPGGTLVGVLQVTDPDVGDSHSLSLVDSAGGRFVLSGNNLTVANGALIDFEQASSYPVTVRATDSGGLSIERTFTITVQNRNETVSFDVQRGASQRSYIRYVDLVFENNEGLSELIASERIRLVRSNLQDRNPVNVGLAGKVRANGSSLELDFGAQGIGGKRNSAFGNGYYRLQMDLDNDGSFETTRTFYRLLGDTNGDRAVDLRDIRNIALRYGRRGPGLDQDVNGDGVVNSRDLTLTVSQLGKRLNNRLWLSD